MENEESFFDGLGDRSTEGVRGDAFTWTQETYLSKLIGAPYTFSLQNRLREPVKNIYCLVMFYDRDERPIGLSSVIYREVIEPGHAKRIKSKIHGKIQRLTTASQSSQKLSTKVKFRILDFQIVPVQIPALALLCHYADSLQLNWAESYSDLLHGL